jgi:hypothetical protein
MEQNKQLKEKTIGCLNLTSYVSTFNISHSENDIIIEVPFKRVVIPFSEIDKITFKKRVGMHWYIGGCWQIEHHCKNAPKNIGFIPFNQEAWLSIFEQKGVNIDDRENLKKVNSAKWEKANRINRIIGAIGIIMVGIGAVVAVIIGILKNR